jgi:hypothetical protein
MKAYIQLGTTGRSIYDLKEEIEQKILKKTLTMKTTDTTNYSCTTYEWIVTKPIEAKIDIDIVFKYLQKQSWYFTDALSFTNSGLIDDDDGSGQEFEWYCEDCGDDLNTCECLKKQKELKKTLKMIYQEG